MIHSGLLVCSFYLKERFVRKEPKIFELNNEIIVRGIENDECYPNVWKLIEMFLSSHISPKDDESSMKLFSIEQGSINYRNTSSYQAVSFVVSSGSYGTEGKMTNRTTKDVVFERTRDDADVKQFYAMILIPKDQENVKVQKGILIFQSIGTYGIKTITTKQMKEFFANMDVTFETRSISVSILLKKILEEGKLNKISLLRNKISPDPSDSMLISSGREETVFFKPKIKENWLKKIINYIDGKKDDTIFEINDRLYEDISISFSFSGRQRTARLKDLDKFSLVEDIPDSIYNNGFTDKEKIINYMISTAEEYKEKMVFTISN